MPKKACPERSRRVYVRTFGWPYIPVRRDDFGAVEEDKRFRMKGLGKFNK